MKKKLLTLEDLVTFCKSHNFNRFNAHEIGYQLSVQVPATMTLYEDAESTDDTLLFCKVKLFHIGRNRNGSNVLETAAEKALTTIPYKPLLANFCEIDGVKDFTSHDMNILEDGTVEYIEKQIGSFMERAPYIEYDEKQQKSYVYAYVAIPREYTDAADIIERKNGTKVSAELIVNAMSYDAKEQVLNLEDIVVQGATCLGKNPETGKDVKEGMAGARLDIADFSVENNSLLFHMELLSEIQEMNKKLSFLNDKNNGEGGNSLTKFEQLLKKYGKTVEDITFEYKGLSDKELEAKFSEVFDSETLKSITPEKYSITLSDGTVKDFALSLNEISSALYMLVNETYSEADNAYYSVQVYEDNTVVMVDWWSNKAFRQSYSRENDNFSLTGERVEVYSNWLTKEEENVLSELRTNYSVIESKLKDYQVKEETALKDALFASEDYSSIADKDEFKALAENHADFSADEIKEKLDSIILTYAKKGNLTFSAGCTDSKVNRKSLPSQKDGKKKNRYGSLFQKNI